AGGSGRRRGLVLAPAGLGEAWRSLLRAPGEEMPWGLRGRGNAGAAQLAVGNRTGPVAGARLALAGSSRGDGAQLRDRARGSARVRSLVPRRHGPFRRGPGRPAT